MNGKGKITREQLSPGFNSEIDDINSQMSEIATNRIIYLDYYMNKNNLTFDQAMRYVFENFNDFTLDLPTGEYTLDTELIIEKNCKIQGKGDNTIITLNAGIKSSTNTKLAFEDIYFINNTHIGIELQNKYRTNFVINKCTFENKLSDSKIIYFNGSYNSETQASILNGYCKIFDCEFKISTGLSHVGTAIEFGVNTRNISVSNCNFLGYNTGINMIGLEGHYELSCGIRIINCMFIDCNTGVYGENYDYVLFSNSMIDYTEKPIILKNVAEPRIINNYIFSYVSHPILDYSQTLDNAYLGRLFFSGNILWNKKYSDSTENHSDNSIIGVKLTGNHYTLSKGIISDNTFEFFNTCIMMDTDYDTIGFIEYFNIHDNTFENAMNGIILNNSHIYYTNIKNNTARNVNTLITDNGTNSVYDYKISYSDITIGLPKNTQAVLYPMTTSDIISIIIKHNDEAFNSRPMISLTNTGIELFVQSSSTSDRYFSLRVVTKIKIEMISA